MTCLLLPSSHSPYTSWVGLPGRLWGQWHLDLCLNFIPTLGRSHLIPQRQVLRVERHLLQWIPWGPMEESGQCLPLLEWSFPSPRLFGEPVKMSVNFHCVTTECQTSRQACNEFQPGVSHILPSQEDLPGMLHPLRPKDPGRGGLCTFIFFTPEITWIHPSPARCTPRKKTRESAGKCFWSGRQKMAWK